MVAEEMMTKQKERCAKLVGDFVWNSLIEEAIRLSKKSIDDQVDSILLRFESDCIIIDNFDEIEESFKHINEAPDDDEQKPELGEPSDKKDEEDVEKKTGNEDDETPDQESDPLQPKIDLHKFAGKVSRLASNYDALLDMPIAIVNRARNYLEQNYSPAVAEEFDEIMEHDFDIELEREITSEPREKSMAVGAAATGLQ
jgi:hypothetical protein